MHREQIREQFSFLEEQLERLSDISLPEITENKMDLNSSSESSALIQKVKNVFGNLQNMVFEETLRQKSLSASEFVHRLSKVLIQEASARGYDINISHRASGRVSLEMVEVAMTAIISCIRTSLKSYLGMSRVARAKLGLFETFSIYIEVCGEPDVIHFKLMDDGQGYANGFKTELETDKQFQKIRAHLAKHGGWFSWKNFQNYGGKIEFKIPLFMNRFESFILKKGDFELLVPCSCVSQVVRNVSVGDLQKNGEILALLDSASGLVSMQDGKKIGPVDIVRIGVADFRIDIVCDSVSEEINIRKFSANNFVSNDSWFENFGICRRSGQGIILPLLEGDALMRFYTQKGEVSES